MNQALAELGGVFFAPTATNESRVQCRKCHRYIDRSPEDDEYIQIETGLTEAWIHCGCWLVCNPRTERPIGEPVVWHEPESIAATWERERSAMLDETRKTLESLR